MIVFPSISSLRAQILEQEEIKLIYSLIGDENGAIRQEVAHFIYETLFEGTQAEETPKKGIPFHQHHIHRFSFNPSLLLSISIINNPIFPLGEKAHQVARSQLRGLLDLIAESFTPEVPNYIVDALWGEADVLKVFKQTTNALRYVSI